MTAAARKPRAAKARPPERAEELELDLRSGALWEEPEGEPRAWAQAWRACVGLCAGRARQDEAARREAAEAARELARRFGGQWASGRARVWVDGAKGGGALEGVGALEALALMQRQAGRNPLSRSQGPHWELAGGKGWRAGDFAPMWAACCEAGVFAEPGRVKGAKKIGEAMAAFASDRELFPFEPSVARALFESEASARAFFKEPAQALGWALRGCLRADAALEAPLFAELIDRLSGLWSKAFSGGAEGLWARPCRAMASWQPGWREGVGARGDRVALWDAWGSAIARARRAQGPAAGSRACAIICQAMTALGEGQAAECCWLKELSVALAEGAGASERDEYGRSPLMILAEAGEARGQSDAAEYEGLLAAAAGLLLRYGARPEDLLRETPEQLAQRIKCAPVRQAVLASMEREQLEGALKAAQGADRGSGRL